MVVDDVELARQRLVRALRAHPDVEVVGEAGNGSEMIEAVHRLKPALLFLDVSMPEQDGFSALAELAPELRPLVVFVTAYAQYALNAFRVEAIDYLLKPAEPAQVAEALARVRLRLALPAAASANEPTNTSNHPERLALRTDGGLRVVSVEAIDWIEAIRNYIAIHEGREAIIVRSTLQVLLTQLDPRRFVRVHRSTVVNILRIRELRPLDNGDQRMVLIDGTELSISRTYREALMGALAR
jgi:two-component system LytT family response regulator